MYKQNCVEQKYDFENILNVTRSPTLAAEVLHNINEFLAFLDQRIGTSNEVAFVGGALRRGRAVSSSVGCDAIIGLHTGRHACVAWWGALVRWACGW
jgi:hypothetical protein